MLMDCGGWGLPQRKHRVLLRWLIDRAARFHVETDKHFDREKLSAMEIIGVTAGASTPNWMINKVVQKIESFAAERKPRWIGFSGTQ